MRRFTILGLLVTACAKAPPTEVGSPSSSASSSAVSASSLPTATSAASSTASSSAASDAGDLAQSIDAGGDAIDRLVLALSKMPLWENGAFAIIELPENAPAEKLIARVYEDKSFRKVVTKRRVHIPAGGTDYLAVLVDTGVKKEVVLLRFMPEKPQGWWNRTFPEGWPHQQR